MDKGFWYRSEPCTARPFVASLIDDYVRHRQVLVNAIVDLWPATGRLLQPLSSLLPCERAVGIVSPSEGLSVGRDIASDSPLEFVVADPQGVEEQALPPLDLVIGIDRKSVV